MAAEADRLAGADVGAGEDDGTLGRLGDLDRVPLQAGLAVGQAGEQGVGPAGGGQLDREDADLGRALRAAGAAERVGQQLVAQADAQERALEVAHPVADRRLLRHQPGMLVDVPDVHRAAHHPELVVAVQRRDRLALVEPDRVPGDAVGGEEAAQHARMLDREMLEHEQPHPSLHRLGRLRGDRMRPPGSSGRVRPARTASCPRARHRRR